MRCFIAVRVPAIEALVAASRQMSTLMPNLNVIPAYQWHVTLQFLGDTAEHLIPTLTSIITGIAATERVQEVSIRGLGVFPNLARPTVLWAGFTESAVLTRMASQLGKQCESLGFPREARAFTPHLTLARLKSRPHESLIDFVRSRTEMEFGQFKVSSLELFRSDLTRVGPEYTVIASAPLSSRSDCESPTR